MITELTPEQEALIPVYRENWSKIALSTEPVDRQKASEAVKSLYHILGIKEPKIIFCKSPFAKAKMILNTKRKPEKLGIDIITKIEKLYEKLFDITEKIDPSICSKLGELFYLPPAYYLIFHTIESEVIRRIGISGNYRSPVRDGIYCLIKDFCISVLNCDRNEEYWQVFQLLFKHCSFLYAFEKVAIICDRPKKIAVDNQGILHAEAEPAIQFRDGYNIYVYHGITLPKCYGILPPKNWETDWYLKSTERFKQIIHVLPVELLRVHWLLEEKNSELRRSLIQRIGYARLCQELQAEKLDTWQDYEILRIDAKIDEEPIHLLKMNCPSTGDIHAIRVPPNMTSARDAVRWINWGIDPQEFSVQT